MVQIHCKMQYSNCFPVEAYGHQGDLALLWLNSIHVNFINYTNNFTNADITILDSRKSFLFIGIYEETYMERKLLFGNSLDMFIKPRLDLGLLWASLTKLCLVVTTLRVLPLTWVWWSCANQSWTNYSLMILVSGNSDLQLNRSI